MKKVMLFVLVSILILTSCDKLQAAEPTQDPLIAQLVTQVAELKSEPTQDPLIAQLVTQVAELEKIASSQKEETVVIQNTETEPVVEETIVVGDWEIQYFAGATSEMKDWVFANLAPETWPEFPNIDNGVYLASQGLEYGEDETTFCEYKETCDFVVPARHYRLYTGDYEFDGVGDCYGGIDERSGCALAVFNVGEVTASFEDQHFDAGFTVWGRYWNGDYLPQAIWALLSHASNNMLNMNSQLNPTKITNAGANCSFIDGCISVEATFVVTSGNEMLVIGRQTINK